MSAWIPALVVLVVAGIVLAIVSSSGKRRLSEAERRHEEDLQQRLGDVERGATEARQKLQDEAAARTAELDTARQELALVREKLAASERDAKKAQEQIAELHTVFRREALTGLAALQEQLAAEGMPERLADAAGWAPAAGWDDLRARLATIRTGLERGGVEERGEIQYLAGMLAALEGDRRGAVNLLRGSVSSMASATAWENLGDLYMQDSRPKSAADAYRNCMRMEPEDASYVGKLGLALMEANNWAQAAKVFNQALALDPKNLDLYMNASFAHGKGGMLDRAVELCEQAEKVFPDRIEPLTSRIIPLGKLKKETQAWQAYGRAITLDPKSSEAEFALGVALTHLGKDDEALKHLESAVALRAEMPEAHLCRGLVHLRRNENERAVECFQTALAQRPDYAEAYYNMNAAYTNLKKFDLAIEALNTAVKLNPDYRQ